jgi:hypothetical protein
MVKFTAAERPLVKSIVASLTIKRLPDSEIIKEIQEQTNKKISRQSVTKIRHQIKKDSYKWYQKLRHGHYEYIHEFKERINEIIWLQQKHHEIIEKYPKSPQIQQTSLLELHKLNLTLSNYFDIAPDIIGNSSIPTSSQDEGKTRPTSEQQEAIIV